MRLIRLSADLPTAAPRAANFSDGSFAAPRAADFSDGGIPADLRGAVIAIGNFDGVHRGHQRVIAETRAIAARLGAPAAVLTFDPHPRRLFAPDVPAFGLASLNAKARMLAALGLDGLFVATFDRAFAQVAAENFIDDILVGRLGVSHVVVGDDFRFGRGRAGDFALLAARGQTAGFGVTPAPKVVDETGKAISSNTIREALIAGDPATAEVLLGRPWEVEGEVVHGDARGRELGFPTANVAMGDYLHPARGVYAVRAGLVGPDGTEWHDGAASFGLRPQFDGQDARLEVFLLDFAGDLYGRTLRVAFHACLRGEQRFADVEALIAQMGEDVAETRRRLGPLPRPSRGA